MLREDPGKRCSLWINKMSSFENPSIKQEKKKKQNQKPQSPQLTVRPECAVTRGRRDALPPQQPVCSGGSAQRKQFNVSIKVNIIESKPNVPIQQSVANSSLFWYQSPGFKLVDVSTLHFLSLSFSFLSLILYFEIVF